MQEAAWTLLSQPGPGGMNLGKGSCIVLHIPVHPIRGLSRTPRFSSATSQPQLHPQDLGKCLSTCTQRPMPGTVAWILRDARWWWGICPSGTCGWVSPTHPCFRSAGRDALSSALPPCSPELATTVWAVNPNYLILLNYFPNDMISPVHINDQFHVLFLALF